MSGFMVSFSWDPCFVFRDPGSRFWVSEVCGPPHQKVVSSFILQVPGSRFRVQGFGIRGSVMRIDETEGGFRIHVLESGFRG